MKDEHLIVWAFLISLTVHILLLSLMLAIAPWKNHGKGEDHAIFIVMKELAVAPKQNVQRDSPGRKVVRPVEKKNALENRQKQPELMQKVSRQQTVKENKPEPAAEHTSTADESASTAQPSIAAVQDKGDWRDDYTEELRALIEESQEYPIMALRNRLEGTVRIDFVLNRHGKLLVCHIHRSCGHQLLDRAALSAVKSVETFPPFPEHIDLDQARFIIPITFRTD